jgi:tRNA threonylcarbamoyladenosine biosynthesis protein TsaB
MDGVTLALDASTSVGTVAVLREGTLVGDCSVAMRGRDEERLMPAVAAALVEAGANRRDVRHVVCGAGPGSFTSLRIAASIAKGLAFGLSVPLYAAPSLALAAVEAGIGRWVVTLDAMRSEVFAAAFEWDGRTLTPLCDEGLFGVGAVAGLAESVGAHVVAGQPHARAAAALVGSSYAALVDLATWEPAYGRLAEAQVRWEAAHGRPLRS